ncbi:hypothetical protein GCM10027040_14940 [Halomonas shantousis]
MTRRQLRSATLVVASLIVLAGCGQKGPLYMPDDRAAAEKYDPTGTSRAPNGPETTEEAAPTAIQESH